MTMEEIRKNAPSGATHYLESKKGILYVKNEMIWFRDSWCFATFSDKSKIKPL